MISRVWHGWTTPANADAYEALLKSEIFTGIEGRRIAGYRGIHLFRRNLGKEVEFVTVMWFDSIEAVRAFAGEDYDVEQLASFSARGCTYRNLLRPFFEQFAGSLVESKTGRRAHAKNFYPMKHS